MKKGAEKQKTRPDLDDEHWLVWVSALPENRGIFVREMYCIMLEWCMKKGVTPTRRRLLRWLDKEREDVPVTYQPFYFEPDKTAPASEIAPPLPDCDVCKNERFVPVIIDPDAKYDWARTGMVPCKFCNIESSYN